MLVEVRLPCGCLALCDANGPVCCLEPCPRYPIEAREPSTDGAENWQEALRLTRASKKATNARRYLPRKEEAS